MAAPLYVATVVCDTQALTVAMPPLLWSFLSANDIPNNNLWIYVKLKKSPNWIEGLCA